MADSAAVEDRRLQIDLCSRSLASRQREVYVDYADRRRVEENMSLGWSG